jgi:DNA-binding LacI/PurR family transcriptional regulator
VIQQVATMPDDVPLYQQLKDLIRQRLTAGYWSAGARLPSTAELCAEHRVSAITVRRALTDLITEGLLRGAQGRGVYVASRQVRTGLLGLVLPGAGSGFLGGIRQGIEHELGGATPLLLGLSDMDPEREATLVARMAADGVDGLLMVPVTGVRTAQTDAAVCATIANGLRTVFIDRSFDAPGVDRVASDNVQAGRLATTHLLALGHRRIACLWAHDCPTFADRRRGWEGAVREHGMAVDPRLARGGWEPSRDYEACGYLHTLELFHLPDPPTAIFACNDPIAVGVLRALRFLGQSVPGAVSVVGNDDAELAQATGLTSVRQDSEAIGRRAAAALLRRIAGATDAAVDERIPTTLTVRGSSGPVA